LKYSKKGSFTYLEFLGLIHYLIINKQYQFAKDLLKINLKKKTTMYKNKTKKKEINGYYIKKFQEMLLNKFEGNFFEIFLKLTNKILNSYLIGIQKFEFINNILNQFKFIKKKIINDFNNKNYNQLFENKVWISIFEDLKLSKNQFSTIKYRLEKINKNFEIKLKIFKCYKNLKIEQNQIKEEQFDKMFEKIEYNKSKIVKIKTTKEKKKKKNVFLIHGVGINDQNIINYLNNLPIIQNNLINNNHSTIINNNNLINNNNSNTNNNSIILTNNNNTNNNSNSNNNICNNSTNNNSNSNNSPIIQNNNLINNNYNNSTNNNLNSNSFPTLQNNNLINNNNSNTNNNSIILTNNNNTNNNSNSNNNICNNSTNNSNNSPIIQNNNSNLNNQNQNNNSSILNNVELTSEVKNLLTKYNYILKDQTELYYYCKNIELLIKNLIKKFKLEFFNNQINIIISGDGFSVTSNSKFKNTYTALYMKITNISSKIDSDIIFPICIYNG
jgi:hypothetical protein